MVLFNLGGPDGPEAVRPFLFNLFNDPAIIDAPKVIRWLLATLISWRRAPTTQKIYRQLDGASPLLANTRAQAEVLERALAKRSPGAGTAIEVFVAMRYWHPLSLETAAQVNAFAPDRIVLLPLYPQFSTTTTGSSVTAWRIAAATVGLEVPTRILCCYPKDSGFVTQVADHLAAAMARASAYGRPRILFSAHGLPEKIIARGDPYQWQVEQSVAAVLEALEEHGPDHRICYQSRVGPLEWIGPSTMSEIERAGDDRVPVVLVPIGFVSEHSETLVELDMDYRRLAEAAGVPFYDRVPTVGCGPAFIAGLADLVQQALESAGPVCAGAGGRPCPARWGRCPRGAP